MKRIISQESREAYQEGLENKRTKYAVTSTQEISQVPESKENNNSSCALFKGIKFNNQSNLCYVNTTINALFNCKSIINLIETNKNCEVINKLKYWINNSDNTHCTESLRELVIRNGYGQFSNKVQSDPDEFMGSLLQISKALKNIFDFHVVKQFHCLTCNDITRIIEPFTSLKDDINDIFISSILQKKQGNRCCITL